LQLEIFLIVPLLPVPSTGRNKIQYTIYTDQQKMTTTTTPTTTTTTNRSNTIRPEQSNTNLQESNLLQEELTRSKNNKKTARS
jgi:hypothetical protein